MDELMFPHGWMMKMMKISNEQELLGWSHQPHPPGIRCKERKNWDNNQIFRRPAFVLTSWRRALVLKALKTFLQEHHGTPHNQTWVPLNCQYHLIQPDDKQMYIDICRLLTSLLLVGKSIIQFVHYASELGFVAFRWISPASCLVCLWITVDVL